MALKSDSDRYLSKPQSLRLVCTKCGSSGLIPLPQLDRAVFCATCRICYRVERNGLHPVAPSMKERIEVAVRTNSSAWRQHHAVLYKRPNRSARLKQLALGFLLQGRARWIVGLGLLGSLVLTLWFSGAPNPPAAEADPLPASLADRAQLLTVALARRDKTMVASLTDPTMFRAMRIWLAGAKDLPAQVPAEATIDSTIVSTTADAKQVENAVVVVRLTVAGGTPCELRQQWSKSEGTWYFKPPKLRSVFAPSAPRHRT